MHGVKAAMRHPPRVLKSCRQQLRRAGGAMVMSAQWPYSLGGGTQDLASHCRLSLPNQDARSAAGRAS